jgi:hypothetical protein
MQTKFRLKHHFCYRAMHLDLLKNVFMMQLQVILPTGTVVTVQSSGSSFINIWIKPSSVDRGNTEGNYCNK